MYLVPHIVFTRFLNVIRIIFFVYIGRFIRLANFLSASTVIFILVLYLMNVYPNQWTEVKNHLVVKHVSTFIQLVYLCFFAIGK